MSESEQNQTEPVVQLQRLYLKDVSFETPNSPAIFQQEWEPEVNLDLDTTSTKLADGVYEVVLRTTVTVNCGELAAFLCEVQQAGIFVISGLDESQLGHCLGAYCPNLLFPYVRECISNLVMRGTFPQLNIAPVINFEALYFNYLQEKNQTPPELQS